MTFPPVENSMSDALVRRAAQSNIVSAVFQVIDSKVWPALGIVSLVSAGLAWWHKLSACEAWLVGVSGSAVILTGSQIWIGYRKERRRREDEQRALESAAAERKRLLEMPIEGNIELDVLEATIRVQKEDSGTIRIVLKFTSKLARSLEYLGFVPLTLELFGRWSITTENAKDVTARRLENTDKITIEIPLRATQVREIEETIPTDYPVKPTNMVIATLFRFAGSLRFRDRGDEHPISIDRQAGNATLQMASRRPAGMIGA
jgi:hypothetical protein